MRATKNPDISPVVANIKEKLAPEHLLERNPADLRRQPRFEWRQSLCQLRLRVSVEEMFHEVFGPQLEQERTTPTVITDVDLFPSAF